MWEHTKFDNEILRENTLRFGRDLVRDEMCVREYFAIRKERRNSGSLMWEASNFDTIFPSVFPNVSAERVCVVLYLYILKGETYGSVTRKSTMFDNEILTFLLIRRSL